MEYRCPHIFIYNGFSNHSSFSNILHPLTPPFPRAVLRQPSSQQCINALTIFTLEARDTMVKMLPEVLLDLSKISDTKAIACPMLEFLSSKLAFTSFDYKGILTYLGINLISKYEIK